jgi:CHAT domain-containing protein
MKKSWFAPTLFLFMIAALAMFELWHPQVSLVELQREYLFAETEAERAQLVRYLEKYYETLPMPESVRQTVEQKVAELIAADSSDKANCQAREAPKDLLYETEQELECLLKRGLTSLVRNQPQLSQRHFEQATELANRVQQMTHGGYWPLFIRTLTAFSKSEATSWLEAFVAEKLCRDFAGDPNSWPQAEYYGSLGLRLSRQVHDLRLELDLIQTLQFILTEYHGFGDLSVAFAESHRQEAQRIRYDLRAIGIGYHQAFALQRSGQFDSALKLYAEVRRMVEEHPLLPSAQWYATKALLKTAEVQRELGHYQEALSVCDRVAETNLSKEDQILLNIARGLVRRCLADYEGAEKDYQTGLGLAESAGNQVDAQRILNDLGSLHFFLTEYDRALEYYRQAKDLQDHIVSRQSTSEIDLLINMAEVNAKQGRVSLADDYLLRASLLTELGSLPWKKAELFNTLGELCLKVERDTLGLTYFQKALAICETNGLARVGLKAKLNLAETFIRQSRFAEASQLASETAELSRRINDPEKTIDSLALLAKIAAAKRDFRGAVRISDSLIQEIQFVTKRLQSVQRLISFQQKIYEYLKQAVLYEIQSQRPELAFLKLEYAKTLWSSGRDKSLGPVGVGGIHTAADLDELRRQVIAARGLAIDFMLAQDALYAFVLDRDGFHLLQKSIDVERLRTRVNSYRTAIDKTAEVLGNYQPKRLEEHFLLTTRLGQQLYDDILGWPALQAQLALSKTVYVIPDEFLYEIPMSTLVTQLGEKTCFLAEKTCVLNISSAFLAMRRSDSKKSLDKSVLVSADPHLPGSKDVLSFAKKQFPGAEELVIAKDNFSKNDVLEKIHQPYQIYIFFGHGKANSAFPEFSYIELTARSSTNSVSKTFQFSLADLQKADWSRAELIWLVGCETAAGKLYRGSGISGLQQSLLALGAHSVLASLWKIDAAQAVPQIRWFLDSWSQVSDPIGAFNEVQRHSIQALSQDSYYRKPHPYLWGSYSFAVSSN